jgi:hypothetical protein
VSVAGHRGAAFDEVEIVSVDVAEERMVLRLAIDDGSPALSVGDGILLQLYFRFLTAPLGSGIHALDVMPYESYEYDFGTVLGSYQPNAIAGELDIRIGLRGDANLSGGLSIGDATHLIDYIFAGGSEPPLYNGDANADLVMSIGDAIYLIDYIFAGGPPPPE